MRFAGLLASTTVLVLPLAGVAVCGNPVPFASSLDVYHLGEADAGAANGVAGDATTTDSGPGGKNLTASGTPTYSSNVPTGIGSTLSIALDGSSYYSLGTPVTTLATNVGIDAYFYPTSANGIVGAVAYNGSSGGSGSGIYQFDTGNDASAHIIALVGGKTFGPSADIPLNQWSELTQFITPGGVDELFVNGVLAGTTTVTPNTPDSGFDLGGPQTVIGNIDEVTVFTTPEPGCLGLLGTGAAACLLRRRARAHS